MYTDTYRVYAITARHGVVEPARPPLWTVTLTAEYIASATVSRRNAREEELWVGGCKRAERLRRPDIGSKIYLTSQPGS